MPAFEPHPRPRTNGPPPRVVVTGIGLCTALGTTREVGWKHLREGRSGLARRATPAALGLRRLDHITQRVVMEACLDARITAPGDIDRERAGVVFGSSKGDLVRLAALHAGHPGTRLDHWLSAWPNSGASLTSATWQFLGPSLAPVAACATGLVAALQGFDLIRRGVCDLVATGAADASLSPFLLAAFRKMRVLARAGETDDPSRAVRPWDKDRSGFLVGEGAAVLILEREDHARARGVRAYCEFAGGAFGADAFHLTNLNPDPSNLADLIGRALAYSDVDPSEIDHVNVHGTATRSNDPLECRALRQALGKHADRVSCSANKGQIGHLLGAAGAVELAYTALAVRDEFIPPTVNLDDPDPACDLDGTPHVGRLRPIRAALKVSIGFGGHLAAAVLRQYDGPRRVPT